MPELPEVETIVNDLKKKVIGRKIKSVWFDSPRQIFIKKISSGPRLIRAPKVQEFEKQIRNLKIENIKRRGKNILIYLSPGKLLLVHQKMTGHLLYGRWRIQNKKPVSLLGGAMREKVNDYIHVIFFLDNGWQLALSDLRKFAKLVLGSKNEVEGLEELKKLGPEPLEKNFDFRKFQQALRGKKGKIKQVLMDQSVISGIGNIYSDEILWLAKIHPFRPANQLKNLELEKIFRFIKEVLKKAVKLRGTSVSDFRDPEGKSGHYANHLYVYQREGEKCPRCKNVIKRLKMGGRSAHFCPHCQKL